MIAKLSLFAVFGSFVELWAKIAKLSLFAVFESSCEQTCRYLQHFRAFILYDLCIFPCFYDFFLDFPDYAAF